MPSRYSDLSMQYQVLFDATKINPFMNCHLLGASNIFLVESPELSCRVLHILGSKTPSKIELRFKHTFTRKPARFILLQIKIEQDENSKIEFKFRRHRCLLHTMTFSTEFDMLNLIDNSINIPLYNLTRSIWTNLVIDLTSFVKELWKDISIQSLVGIAVHSTCWLAKILALRIEVEDSTFKDHISLLSPSGCITQVINLAKVRMIMWKQLNGKSVERNPTTSLKRNVRPGTVNPSRITGKAFYSSTNLSKLEYRTHSAIIADNSESGSGSHLDFRKMETPQNVYLFESLPQVIPYHQAKGEHKRIYSRAEIPVSLKKVETQRQNVSVFEQSVQRLSPSEVLAKEKLANFSCRHLDASSTEPHIQRRVSQEIDTIDPLSQSLAPLDLDGYQQCEDLSESFQVDLLESLEEAVRHPTAVHGNVLPARWGEYVGNDSQMRAICTSPVRATSPKHVPGSVEGDMRNRLIDICQTDMSFSDEESSLATTIGELTTGSKQEGTAIPIRQRAVSPSEANSPDSLENSMTSNVPELLTVQVPNLEHQDSPQSSDVAQRPGAMLNLIYDPILDHYYDPRSGVYYEMIE